MEKDLKIVIIGGILAGIFTIIATSIPLFYEPPVNPHDSESMPHVVLYEHDNYGGKSKDFFGDNPALGDDFNDITSSLTVPQGYKLTLYEHANYGGSSKEFTDDTPQVGADFNDIASSLKIIRMK